MNEIRYQTEDGKLVFFLCGPIDAVNAPVIEAKISKICADHPEEAGSITLDFEKLEYISSAGLRMVNRLKQKNDDTKIINASLEIYNILDMTGFTDMMHVEKAYRVISVEGCEVIGQGANGKVYRIDRETILKAYMNQDSLEEIDRERMLARTAFAAGIPTAIPYDVVRIEGGGYGAVYELLDAETFARLLSKKEKTIDELAKLNIDLLKLIHSKTARRDTIPDMKEKAIGWLDDVKDYLPDKHFSKLNALFSDMPADMHLVHGDFHIKNVMMQNDEVLLIDMDTLSHGLPVFDLASMYTAYVGLGDLDRSVVENFLGISYDETVLFWNKCLPLYLGTEDKDRLKEAEEQVKLVSYTRIMRREIRHHGINSREGWAMVEHCRDELNELLPKVKTLLL